MSRRYQVERKLFLVENAQRGDAIVQALGSGVTYLSTQGFLWKLKEWVVSSHRPNFVPTNDKHFDHLAAQVAAFRGDIYLAMENTREGEFIAYSCVHSFELPPSTRRLRVGVLSKETLLVAMREADLDLREYTCCAVVARMASEWLCARHFTAAVQKEYPSFQSQLGIGHFAALQLLENHQQQLETLPPCKELARRQWTAVLWVKGRLSATMTTPLIGDESEVQAWLRDPATTSTLSLIERVTDEGVDMPPAPRPFSLSALMQAAEELLGFTPAATQELCLNLFQHELITNPLTDSDLMCAAFRVTCTRYVERCFGKHNAGTSDDAMSRILVFSDSGSSTTASTSTSTPTSTSTSTSTFEFPRECIRPLSIDKEELPRREFTVAERQLYQLIWQRTVQSCMARGSKDTMRLSFRNAAGNTFVATVERPHGNGYNKAGFQTTVATTATATTTTTMTTMDTSAEEEVATLVVDDPQAQQHRQHHHSDKDREKANAHMQYWRHVALTSKVACSKVVVTPVMHAALRATAWWTESRWMEALRQAQATHWSSRVWTVQRLNEWGLVRRMSGGDWQQYVNECCAEETRRNRGHHDDDDDHGREEETTREEPAPAPATATSVSQTCGGSGGKEGCLRAEWDWSLSMTDGKSPLVACSGAGTLLRRDVDRCDRAHICMITPLGRKVLGLLRQRWGDPLAMVAMREKALNAIARGEEDWIHWIALFEQDKDEDEDEDKIANPVEPNAATAAAAAAPTVNEVEVDVEVDVEGNVGAAEKDEEQKHEERPAEVAHKKGVEEEECAIAPAVIAATCCC